MKKIPKNAILHLSSMGRTTLQVPELAIQFGGVPTQTDVDVVPDNWLCRLKSGYVVDVAPAGPAAGNEQGFLFLTSIGWTANKSNIEQSFKNSHNLAHLTSEELDEAWKEFEIHANEHFKSLRKSIKAEIAKARGQFHATRFNGSNRSQKYWKKKLFELRSFVV